MRDMSRAAIEARDYAYQTIGAVLHWSSAAGANFGDSVTDELVGEIRAMRNKPSLFTPIQKGKKSPSMAKDFPNEAINLSLVRGTNP